MHNVKKKTPKDMNAALNDAMTSVQKLGTIYTTETNALNTMDQEAFSNIQAKKLDATKTYQDIMASILRHKGDIQKADPAIKEKIRAVYADFKKKSQQNIEALNRMERATQRLGNTLRNAAIREAQKDRKYSYGATGSIPVKANRRAVSSGLSETV